MNRIYATEQYEKKNFSRIRFLKDSFWCLIKIMWERVPTGKIN